MFKSIFSLRVNRDLSNVSSEEGTVSLHERTEIILDIALGNCKLYSFSIFQ